MSGTLYGIGVNQEQLHNHLILDLRAKQNCIVILSQQAQNSLKHLCLFEAQSSWVTILLKNILLHFVVYYTQMGRGESEQSRSGTTPHLIHEETLSFGDTAQPTSSWTHKLPQKMV